jgi:hypothetical protein
MKSSMFLFLLSTSAALAWFAPNVRIDHQYQSRHYLVDPAITVGPGAPLSQPIYVAFEDDSTAGSGNARADIMFQKSTDAGRTWLSADVLVRRGGFALRPDIAADAGGNVYVVYAVCESAGDKHVSCARSSDGGFTWMAPARVSDSGYAGLGHARIAVDSADNLFAAWNAGPDDNIHIRSSVSTDKGATWSPSVRVCRDTAYPAGCYQADVFVQPGTNHYLVTAQVSSSVYLYRSTDMGATFQPGFRLDTSGRYLVKPSVVADRDHIVCEYVGSHAETRTLYTEPDTWGFSQTAGPAYAATLAISADGQLHTALMAHNASDIYLTYYASSSDHGVSWSEPELVSDDTMVERWYPDIAVNYAGRAYIVWQDEPGGHAQIWFSTNNPLAIAEEPEQASRGTKAHVIGRYDQVEVEYQLPASARVRAALYDALGRQVGFLDAGKQKSGAHRLNWNHDAEGRRLSAGAYFVLLDMGTEQARLKAVVR